MRLVVFLLIIYCTAINAAAQVPGYMGKKFILGYNAYFAPNILEFTSGNNLPFKVYTRHVFHADYTVSRRIEIGLQGGFMMHTIPTELTEGRNGPWKLNGTSAGANLRLHVFKGNPVSPLGSYLKMNIQRVQYTLIDEFGLLRETDTEPRRVERTYEGYGAGIGVGVRRIFFNTLTLDAGVDANLVVINQKEYTYMNYNENVRVFAATKHLINYHIGIGALLF